MDEIKRFKHRLYYIHFGPSNPHSAIRNAMADAFGLDDRWIAFDHFTYLVYTPKEFDVVQRSIGIHTIGKIDDFMVMNVGYVTAMTTFTDRNDIIAFLRSIKRSTVRPMLEYPSQERIDELLDKVSEGGMESLSPREIEMLRLFRS